MDYDGPSYDSSETEQIDVRAVEVNHRIAIVLDLDVSNLKYSQRVMVSILCVTLSATKTYNTTSEMWSRWFAALAHVSEGVHVDGMFAHGQSGGIDCRFHVARCPLFERDGAHDLLFRIVGHQGGSGFPGRFRLKNGGIVIIFIFFRITIGFYWKWYVGTDKLARSRENYALTVESGMFHYTFQVDVEQQAWGPIMLSKAPGKKSNKLNSWTHLEVLKHLETWRRTLSPGRDRDPAAQAVTGVPPSTALAEAQMNGADFTRLLNPNRSGIPKLLIVAELIGYTSGRNNIIKDAIL